MNRQPGRANVGDWLLAQFTGPAPFRPRWALLAIVVAILSIAVADFVLEIRVSLTVFYFVPILLAVGWLGSRAAVAVACASIAFKIVGDFIEVPDHVLPAWSWWNSLSTLLVLLLVVWVFGKLVALYRELEERVAERTEENLRLSEHRRLLERELLTVSSNERNRMGQELHDDICQQLVGSTLAAQVLAQRLQQQANPLASDAQGIVSMMETGIGKTRQLARGLLLSEIEPEALPERLAELVDEAGRAGRVRCDFRHTGDAMVADAATAAQLYRIAQEGLRNATRHAGATHVQVTLAGDRQGISLTVEDDGKGLPQQRMNSGMGLPIMSHRAAFIGAKLWFMPTDKAGTRLTCLVPSQPVAS